MVTVGIPVSPPFPLLLVLNIPHLFLFVLFVPYTDFLSIFYLSSPRQLFSMPASVSSNPLCRMPFHNLRNIYILPVLFRSSVLLVLSVTQSHLSFPCPS